MLYRGISREYEPSETISWWALDVEHAVRYCFGQEGATLLATDETGLRLIDCPEAIGESWLGDSESAQFAIALLRGMKVDGFRRQEKAGMAICLLPEAVRSIIFEQF